MNILALLLCLVTPLLGYWIATLTPDETKAGRHWFALASILGGLALLALFTWWKGLLLAAAFVIGFLPGVLALAWLGTTTGLASVQLGAVLGLILGSRWKAEGRSLTLLSAAVGVCAGIALIASLYT